MDSTEQLTTGDLDLILESLKYSKLSVGESEITPYEIKKEKLGRIDALADKVRKIRNSS